MRIFIASLAVVALSQGISAQTVATPVLTDEQFVQKVARGGHIEAEAGRFGASMADSADVKAFAQRMATAHLAASDALVELAAAKKMAIKYNTRATAPVFGNRAEGPEFDAGFMRQVVREHEAALELFERESQNGKDADIKAWATATLPTLRDHLREAREIYSKAYRAAYTAKQARK